MCVCAYMYNGGCVRVCVYMYVCVICSSNSMITFLFSPAKLFWGPPCLTYTVECQARKIGTSVGYEPPSQRPGLFSPMNLLELLQVFPVPSSHCDCLLEPFELCPLTSVLSLSFPAGMAGPGRCADALSRAQGRRWTLTTTVMTLFLRLSSWIGAKGSCEVMAIKRKKENDFSSKFKAVSQRANILPMWTYGKTQ